MTMSLSNTELMKLAPSVFADFAIDGLSPKYAFIPTINIVDAFRAEGWEPVAATQNRCRLPERRGFVKHCLRFRRHDAVPVLDGVYPELALVNSHNGTSAYDLYAGLFRLICLNGMVASLGNLEALKVRHSGNALDNVIDGSFRIIETLPQVIESAEVMRSVQLDRLQQMQFAEAALALRYDPMLQAPISPLSLLDSRRIEDGSNDMWTVFNRVQENMIRGGVRGIGSTGRRMSTRAIKSVNEDIRVNRSLWQLASDTAVALAA
jgi:hypothetical protein